MHSPLPLGNEHRICFQAFLSSPELSEFLLNNRFQQIQATMPRLSRVIVVIQGNVTVKPHHVTSLACLLEEYRLAGITIAFEDASPVVYPYLQSIGFLDRWGPTQIQESSFLIPSDSTSFVLWKAEPQTLDTYANQAYQHYHNCFFIGKDLSFLTTYLAELFNNVFDHAFAADATERIAFGFLQYYPSRGRLFISVSDFGMGIPTSVNQFLSRQNQETVTATEALRMALQLHFTAQSHPHNRGRGLDTLSTGIQALKGRFAIQTARVIYYASESGKVIFHGMPSTPFPGTTTTITVFYNNLPPEELDVLEDGDSLF